MKTNDLTIGTAYAIGSRQNRDSMQALLTRGVVHEVRVDRRTVYGGGYWPSYSADGVRVVITHRRGKELDRPEEAILRPAEILMPWSQYDEQARVDYIAALAVARFDKGERMARVQTILRELLGEDFRIYGSNNVKLTLDEIETLVVNLRPQRTS